jgi:hypothetical protein
MTYVGTVQGGVVVLEGGAALPEGTRVRVEPDAESVAKPSDAQPQGGTLGQRLLKFAGSAAGLPPDLAEFHDCYIHGTPRGSEAGGE